MSRRARWENYRRDDGGGDAGFVTISYRAAPDSASLRVLARNSLPGKGDCYTYASSVRDRIATRLFRSPRGAPSPANYHRE